VAGPGPSWAARAEHGPEHATAGVAGQRGLVEGQPSWAERRPSGVKQLFLFVAS
jgi:hypothetical protein